MNAPEEAAPVLHRDRRRVGILEAHVLEVGTVARTRFV
jgi:hypothetical protein